MALGYSLYVLNHYMYFVILNLFQDLFKNSQSIDAVLKIDPDTRGRLLSQSPYQDDALSLFSQVHND